LIKYDRDLLRVLNAIADPELGIGIVDVGLIYRAEWTKSGIEVEFSTTIPSCPHVVSLQEQIELALRQSFRESPSIDVRLVFDPPWSLDRLSDAARKALGWAAPPSEVAQPSALPCWGMPSARRH